jgi:hypothetical protein
MSELGNQHNYLCPQCRNGDQLQVVVSVWADLTPDGTSIDSNDEWDSDSLARCACGWNGRVKDFVALPEPEGPMSECSDCGTEFAQNQLDEIKDFHQRVAPGEGVPTGECPSCGALCHSNNQSGGDHV